ncbi:MAG: Rrf2 family transcriptional regulator [Deltaproteobacteria bacterium]|jgi:Rrf2 family protein|nr:Rrf2 family transcriptional regulator [Deltaproteobacteria bacterium]
MKLSTRVRYGVRLMVELAERYGQGPVFLKEIAAELGLSEKYLSLIVIPLRSAGLLYSARGASGGYSLARDPREISLREVVGALEGELCLVDCVRDPSTCDRTSHCPSREVWEKVGDRISEALSQATLAQMAYDSQEKRNKAVNYEI